MSSDIKKREVFYLAGYDPRGARHYHNLYKKESILQSKVNGMDIKVSSRKRIEKHIQRWKIDSYTDNNLTQTNYNFLEWDDIIRKDWKKSFLSLFTDLIYALKIYIFSGLIFKYGKISPVQMIAAFYPVAYLLFTLFVSCMTWYISILYTEEYLPLIVAMIISLLPAYLIMKICMYIGNSLAVFLLLRIYVFSAQYVFEKSDDLEERMDEFAKHIRKVIDSAEENEIDEILIVSHSVGSILAIPILAKALTQTNTSFSNVSIMTLGECIPLVSFIDEATTYKDSMHTLASQPNVCWLDYTTAIDGACFPLLDYYKHSGVHGVFKSKPQYLSPRFHTLFSKQRYGKLRKNRYLTHFVYLMSTEITGNYDFFKMTSGNKSLSNYNIKGN